MTVSNLSWKLRVELSREQVLSAAKVHAFLGNIRTLLEQWPNEVTEKDFRQFANLMHALQRLACVDREFLDFLDEFPDPCTKTPPCTDAGGKDEVVR